VCHLDVLLERNLNRKEIASILVRILNVWYMTCSSFDSGKRTLKDKVVMFLMKYTS
jgi:hypothetical protein